MLPIYLHLSFIGLPQNRAFVPFEIAFILPTAFLMVSRIPHFLQSRSAACHANSCCWRCSAGLA